MQSVRQAKGAALHLRGLTKLYHDTMAVDDFSLDIEAGEFMTLLGPSGSGKSTTLMIIAGFVVPTSGDLLVNGASMVTLPPFTRNLGIVFQQYSLFPHLNVFQNIAFPLQMRAVQPDRIRQKVGAALELVRLSGMENRRPSQLSGGQQQRVALARALVFEPDVLLLDEPLGALDLKLRQELQAEIRRVHEELGVTVIYVTHDQGEALSMSDRIVVMNDGAIEQVGHPQELYRSPANAFVANFIGESNLFDGVVVGSHDSACTVRCADGILLRGATRGTAARDAQLTMLVRPESIVLASRDVRPPQDDSIPENLLEGVIEDVIYLGEVSKYRIRLGPSTVITAAWQNRGNAPQLVRGAKIAVGWPMSDTIGL
jgi:putative spermidine/putrescine transport system ATP-binding protein